MHKQLISGKEHTDNRSAVCTIKRRRCGGVRATDYGSFILPLKPIVGLGFNLFKNIWQKIGEIKSPIAPYMAPLGFIINVWDLLMVCFSGKMPALWMKDVPFASSNPIGGVPMAWQLLAMHNRRKQPHILEIVLVQIGKCGRLGGSRR